MRNKIINLLNTTYLAIIMTLKRYNQWNIITVRTPSHCTQN